ncbi:DNA ligase 1-like [Neocloeon triangulifer]|uniref:DNA ligase 1-like n=1 Tax=Neocloeon triangulifer TaxID=2078957 RepID=UPI00286F532D|nr:DNA ligase 1-like [Neocloeon triangulifer]XP_059480063.1 DNA ligase 1-like [Neocloeon triangulifer]XP_059480064.1 DNA ligase 1-like [Neocloeon triangulifer]XP_059480065.1 DNA ligase 1-like [Neocloeon triangulifer]
MGDQDIEIIELSDDEEDEAPDPVKNGPMPSTSAQKIPAALSSKSASNGEKVVVQEKSKNEEALAMLTKGLLALGKNEKETSRIVSKMEKKFLSCSEKFRESVNCYELISKYHKLVQEEPKKKWQFVKEFNDSLTSHCFVKKPVVAKEDEAANNKEKKQKTVNGDAKLGRIELHLKKLEDSLEICVAKIKQLDEEEVDLNDDKASAFIIKRKYEERAAQLYTKIQEYLQKLTGEVGESIKVRHPKICTLGLSELKIDAINTAIDKFVNRSRQNEEIIFPNFREINSIVTRVNREENIGMSKDEVEQYARQAFQTVGKKIKKCRAIELRSTLNDLIANAPDDPADNDPELLRKLAANKKISEQKETEVFEKYVKESAEKEKEEELNSDGDENENNDINEEEAEKEEDEDDYEVVSVHGKSEDGESSRDPFENEELDIDLNEPAETSPEEPLLGMITEENDETEIVPAGPEVPTSIQNTTDPTSPSTSDQAVPIGPSANGQGTTRAKEDALREIETWSDMEVDGDDERNLSDLGADVDPASSVCIEADCPNKIEDLLPVDGPLDNTAANDESSFNPIIVSVESQVPGFSQDDEPVSEMNDSAAANNFSTDVLSLNNNSALIEPSLTHSAPVPETKSIVRTQKARKSFPRPTIYQPDDVECVILD